MTRYLLPVLIITLAAGCALLGADEPLESTQWTLTELSGAPFKIGEQRRVPHLVLQPERKRVVGSGGCNRLVGSYTLDGDRLALGQMAATRMACEEGMDTEARFLAALALVTRAKVTRQQLELLDAGGGVVARFEAAQK